MSDVIQCPQCDKRFRLPEKVPPTFSCTGCGTLMDLSDFGGADAAPPEPVAPAAPSAPAAGAAVGTPRTRTQRRRGGGRRGGARGGAPSRRAGGGRRGGARAGGRRGRGRAAHDDEPHGDYAHRAQARQGNGLLIGSLIGLAAAIILVVVMLGKGGDDEGGGGKTDVAGGGNTPGADGTKGGTKGVPGATPGAKGVPTAADGSELTSSGGGTGDTEEVVSKKPKRSGRVRLSGLKLEKFPWPEGVDEETKGQVDEAIQNLYRGGRDGNEAEDYLMSKGRIICGRVISEFRRIEESPGFNSREGASMCMTIDTVLRKIDGVIERKFFEENFIRASSSPTFILGQAKRWTWWWKHEEWKNSPREPFDPFSETMEDIREAAKGGKKKKKSGFTKRAGG